jgi:hypothetical protein
MELIQKVLLRQFHLMEKIKIISIINSLINSFNYNRFYDIKVNISF